MNSLKFYFQKSNGKKSKKGKKIKENVNILLDLL